MPASCPVRPHRGQKQSLPDASPLRFAPAAGVTLPALAPDIALAGSIERAPEGPIRILAEALVLEGILTDAHFSKPLTVVFGGENHSKLDDHLITDAVHRAVTGFVHESVRDLKAFIPAMFSFTYAANACNRLGGYAHGDGFRGGHNEYDDEDGDDDSTQAAFIVEKESGWIARRLINPEFRSLAPALAGPIFQALQIASDITGSVFMPNDGIYLIQHHYWRGENDESEIFEEYYDEARFHLVISATSGSTHVNEEMMEFTKELGLVFTDICAKHGITREDIVWDFSREWIVDEYNIVTKAEIDKAFGDCPGWALHPCPPYWWKDKRKLAPIPDKAPAQWRAAAAVARSLKALNASVIKDYGQWNFNQLSHFEYSSILTWHAILRWTKDDPMGRVFDDAHNDLAQSGGEEDPGPHFVASYAACDVASIRAALRKLRVYFQLIRLIDELLTLISHKY